MDYMFKSGVCRSDITLGSIHSNNSARDSVRGGGGRPTVLLFRARGKRERKGGPIGGTSSVSQRRHVAPPPSPIRCQLHKLRVSQNIQLAGVGDYFLSRVENYSALLDVGCCDSAVWGKAKESQ